MRQGTPNILEAALLGTIERAVNTALRHDPATLQQLANYSGHLLQFILRFPARELFVLIVEDGVEIYHSSEAMADVSVQGSALDMAAQLLGVQRAEQLIGGPLSIRGNQQLLQEVSELAKHLELDWGAMLSPVLGSEIAQQIDHTGRQLFGWLRNAGTRLLAQSSDYLRHETQLLPSKRALTGFACDVEELELATERLAARVEQLAAKDKA